MTGAIRLRTVLLRLGLALSAIVASVLLVWAIIAVWAWIERGGTMTISPPRVSGTVPGQLGFAKVTARPMPTGLAGAAAGDLDGDGAEELVIAGTGGELLLLRQVDGGYSLTQIARLPAGPYRDSTQVAVCDTDGDGSAEVFVSFAAAYQGSAQWACAAYLLSQGRLISLGRLKVGSLWPMGFAQAHADGQAALLWRLNGALYLLRVKAGALEWELLSDQWPEAIEDFDGDGESEYVIGPSSPAAIWATGVQLMRRERQGLAVVYPEAPPRPGMRAVEMVPVRWSDKHPHTVVVRWHAPARRPDWLDRLLQRAPKPANIFQVVDVMARHGIVLCRSRTLYGVQSWDVGEYQNEGVQVFADGILLAQRGGSLRAVGKARFSPFGPWGERFACQVLSGSDAGGEPATASGAEHEKLAAAASLVGTLGAAGGRRPYGVVLVELGGEAWPPGFLLEDGLYVLRAGELACVWGRPATVHGPAFVAPLDLNGDGSDEMVAVAGRYLAIWARADHSAG